ncbi:hypothetical protein RhiirA4_468443 [Rhizophagus irregularis]|uniref:Uncharacterized protein n=1 Tax=Rhizophagus irregularis TaxID=588596 RepID=A0A2I1GXQ7_9GLOM|nr:hypothetical protein RhiirA4_468443 [Rhizophagus irregularis]
MSNNKFITYPVKRDLNVEWEKFSNMITHKGEVFRNDFSIDINKRDEQIKNWQLRYKQYDLSDKLNDWKKSRLDSRESKNFRREFIGPLKRGRELSCIYLTFNPRQSKVDLFVTTGTTFLKTWSLSESADEWKNGYIESPEEKECIQFIKTHPNEAAALILSKNDNSFKIVWS